MGATLPVPDSLEAPESVGARRRHAWDSVFCGYLERILAGQSAAEVLDALPDRPRRAALVCLPAWKWLPANIDVGRKGIGARGTSLLLPVRITWKAGEVVTLEPGSHDLAWKAVGMGHNFSGVQRVTVSSSLTAERSSDGLVIGPPISGRVLRSRLRELVDDGNEAWWRAREQVEPALLKALRVANSSVSTELHPNNAYSVLSATDIEVICTEMLFGEDQGPRSASTFGRLIARCLDAKAFVSVDPARYVTVNLRRDAKEAVRRHIGDPRVGPKVRRLHSAGRHGRRPEDIEEFVEAYRDKYPSDRLAYRRAAVALGIGVEPPSVPIALNEAVERRYEMASWGSRREAADQEAG
jgi:hypothetical protein